MSEKPQLDSDVSEKPGTSPTMPSDLAEEKVRNEGAAGRSESERALPRNVSRETSETPELTPEQKMLNDIMDRAMAKSQAELKEKRVETAPQEETPSPEKEDAPPPPPEKNKPSSAYVYLAVLFGAAFLMLLLAYFVQQRNNDAVLDDLRSTTASREELLEEIKVLEAERDQLQDSLERQRTHNDALEQQKEQFQETSDEYWEELIQMTAWYDNHHILDCLEQFNRSGDYLMSGTVVSGLDGMFNRNSPYNEDRTLNYLTPAQESRYMELREELFDKSGFMVLTQSVDGKSLELPAIAEGTFEPEVMETAQYLWGVIRNYAIAPDWAAMQLADHSDSLNSLNNKVFKQSTIDLYEEIKVDLIAQGHLVEKDGVLTAVDPPEVGVFEDSTNGPTAD